MSKPEMTEAIDWKTAVEISDIPRVLEAIVNLEDSKSEDNAVCLIRIIASELRQRERTGEAVGWMAVIPKPNGTYEQKFCFDKPTGPGISWSYQVFKEAPPSPPSSRELMEKIKAVFKTHKDTAIAYGFTGDADMFSIIEDEVLALIPQEPLTREQINMMDVRADEAFVGLQVEPSKEEGL
jgi:hypothetical protein